jgi:16S rRNA (guanine527-N7)-methyltransferase
MVSRETSAQAEAIFGDRLPLIERYAQWLADQGVVRGLLGPREVNRIWDRHIINSALVSEFIPPGATVADLGSGAGLPGIPLALARPDVSVTLVEPLLRRMTFLTEVLADLQSLATEPLKIELVRGRAEELHGKATFDVVTARALAPLERLVGWAAPLLGSGGQLVALKGSSAGEEIEQAASALAKAGLSARREARESITVVIAS